MTPAPVGAAARWRARVPEIAAALLGVAWFAWLGGWRAIPPTSLEAFAHGDSAQHVLGWLFFRRSAWGLPLGRLEGYLWPVPTTVGFTDSNPLIAIPAKLLSPLLPDPFQYVGAWLVACFALQGWCGARLAALGTARAIDRVLAGAMFVMAPPLTRRAVVGHKTLCAHFALLLLVALQLRRSPDRASARRSLLASGAIVVLLGAVHAYLAAMALALMVALCVERVVVDRVLAVREVAVRLGVTALLLAGVLGALGFFGGTPLGSDGFGWYAADLAGLVNPVGSSWIVPTLPVAGDAGDGFAYLGLGGLALALIALCSMAADARTWARRLVRAAPLVAACLLLGAFSLTNVVRLAGHEVIGLRTFYRPLEGVVAPFRGAGRFVWPLYYLTLTVALLASLRALASRPALRTIVLGSVVVLQLVELAPRAASAAFGAGEGRPLGATWELARGRYRHLALVPPQTRGVVGGACADRYADDERWIPFAWLAWSLRMTVNSGYVARGAPAEYDPYCVVFDRDFARATAARDTIYIPDAPSLRRFLTAGARCGKLDGHDVCVWPDADDPFAKALAQEPR